MIVTKSRGVGAINVGSPTDVLTGAQYWLHPTEVPAQIVPTFSSGNVLLIAGFLAVPYLLYTMLMKGHRR